MPAQNTLEVIIKANDQASKTLSGVFGKVSSGFDKLGSKMMKTGLVMAGAATPFIAGMKSALDSATQYEESMANVGAVLGKSKEQMSGLSAEILAMGSASRAGPQATAQAFYDIVGGVADASSHMAILEAAIKTSEAGAADLGATTQVLISTMNAYSLSAEDAAMVSDVLTQTVGKGVGTMDDFAAALPQVTSLAASMGVSFENVGAMMAFMTTKGLSASQSATQLRAIMTSLLNPNAQMAQSLQELGFASGAAAVEQLGLEGTLQALAASSPTFQGGMAAAMGSVEALNGVIILTDENFASFERSFIDSAEGATDAARKIQLESLAAQTDLLKSSMEGLKITIGTALIPVIINLVNKIQPIIQSLTDWVRKNPELIQTIAPLIAGAGALGAALAALGGILTTVAGGFGLLLSPIGLVVAAIAAFGIAYRTNFLGFADFIDGLITSVKTLATDIQTAFGEGGLAGVGKLLMDKIANGIGDLGTWVLTDLVIPIGQALINADWSAIGQTGLVILRKIAEGYGDIQRWLWITLPSKIIAFLITTDWSAVLEAGLSIMGKLAEGLGDINQWVIDKLFSPIISGIMNEDNLSKIIEAAYSLGTSIMNGILNAMIDLPGKIAGLIWSAIPEKIDLGLLGSVTLRGGGGGSDYDPTAVRNQNMPGTSGLSPAAQAVQGHYLGGPVAARVPILVGDKGPEVFVPSGVGNIVPNSDLHTGGGTSYNLAGASIVLPGVTNARQFLEQLETEAKRENKTLTKSRGVAWR